MKDMEESGKKLTTRTAPKRTPKAKATNAAGPTAEEKGKEALAEAGAPEEAPKPVKQKGDERALQPLLAATVKTIADVKFPCGVTPKIDGIRAMKVDGKLVTRTFKPLRNKKMSEILARLLPEGADGEITCGNFQETSSAVMREAGSESFNKKFTFHWFDIIPVAVEDRKKTYKERLAAMRTHIQAIVDVLSQEGQVTIIPLFPEIVENEGELLALEEKYLAEGLEGAMIRRMDGPYHMGRATLKSGILSKLKRFSDAEATVIGFEELMRNENVTEKDAFGRTKRAQGKDGLVPAGTLGSLIVRREEDQLTFNIGTGFSSADRAEIWANRDAYLGKLVTYRSFLLGVKTAPRFPSYVGLRLDL